MIIGHQKQWEILKKSAQSGKIAHGLLFHGLEKLGKKTLAIEFAKFLNCQEKDSQKKPCGSCKSCLDIENNSYPDFILLKPDENNLKEKEIKISQIRSLIEKLSLRPYCSDYKIAVLDKAHLMNQQAQNCFLKFLEEPKGKAILILITEYPQLLLPTIISRVQKMSFRPVSKKEIESYLIKQGSSKEKAKSISFLSLNKPGEAIEFFLDPKKIKQQKEAISSLDKIINSDLAFRFQYAKKLSEGKTDLSPREVLGVWLTYFRNILLEYLSNGEKPTTFKKYSVEKMRSIIELIQMSNYLITHTNTKSRLIFENLLMEI